MTGTSQERGREHEEAILAAGLLLLAGGAHAQELKKGNLVGTHHMTVKLEPGVTMDQFVDSYNKKDIPAAEKSRPGWPGRQPENGAGPK